MVKSLGEAFVNSKMDMDSLIAQIHSFLSGACIIIRDAALHGDGRSIHMVI